MTDISFVMKYNEIAQHLKADSNLEGYIKLEICKIIIDNLDLLSLNDSKLILLKEYCKRNIEKPINSTPYELLITFVNEALEDLTTTELYDFRSIE